MTSINGLDPKSVYFQMRMELARRSYEEYLQVVSHGAWKPLPHLKPITDMFQRIIDGEKGMRVIINCPPQIGKSFTGSEHFPSFYLGHFPHNSVMVAAYGDHLSRKFGRSNRKAIQEFGEHIFGRGIDPTKAQETEFRVNGGRGLYYGVTMRGGATGEGADLLIIDDPIKNRGEANSKVERDKIWEEWDASFKSRLRGGVDANVIVIMTRWHEDDFCGRLIKKGGWEQIILRAEAEEDDILGRKPGEPIAPYAPLYRDAEWLAEMKKETGTQTYVGLYQQRPAPPDGQYFMESWFKYYRELPVFAVMGISVDATFKDSDTSDYVVIQVWGYNAPNFYLVHEYRKQMGFGATLKAIQRIMKMFPRAFLKLVEDKANGSAIIDQLKDKVPGVVPVNPDGGKEARANAVSPFFEAGNVYLPHEDAVFDLVDRDGVPFTLTNKWVEDYKTELKYFPAGSNDDRVDATTQIINHWAKPGKRKRPLPKIQGA